MIMKIFSSVVAWVLVLLASPVLAQQNPPSEVIANLTIHPERTSIGNGDNWPITWADDGDQYTVYCDGEGFGGGKADQRLGRRREPISAPYPTEMDQRGRKDLLSALLVFSRGAVPVQRTEVLA